MVSSIVSAVWVLPGFKTALFSCRSLVYLCSLAATALSNSKTSAFSCQSLTTFGPQDRRVLLLFFVQAANVLSGFRSACLEDVRFFASALVVTALSDLKTATLLSFIAYFWFPPRCMPSRCPSSVVVPH